MTLKDAMPNAYVAGRGELPPGDTALVARRAAAVALAPVGPLTVVTDRRLLAADGAALPLEAGTKAGRLVKLDDDEAVAAVVADALH